MQVDAINVTGTAVVTGSGSSGGGGTSTYPSGYHALAVAINSLCLDNYGATSTAGAVIDEWACNGGTNQQFEFVPTSGGYGELQIQNSGQDVAVSERFAGPRARLYGAHVVVRGPHPPLRSSRPGRK
jgi:hypothetical protein